MEQEELFIVQSDDVYFPIQSFNFEGDARVHAEQIARANRGARVRILRQIAFVQEPLPALEWSDGREAGSGLQRGGLIQGQRNDACNQKAETPLARGGYPMPMVGSGRYA